MTSRPTDADRVKVLTNALRVTLAALNSHSGSAASITQRAYARVLAKAALGMAENADDAQLRRFEAVMEGR